MSCNDPYCTICKPANKRYQQHQECHSFKHTMKDPKDVNLNIHVIGSHACPTSQCSYSSACPDQATLTTGPFHVPFFPEQGARANDRLIITLKNPTNCPLSATVGLSVCPEPVQPVTPAAPPVLFNFNTAETPVSGFPQNVTVPANSCRRIEVAIGPFRNATLRLTTTGPYAICDAEPVCGALEISVAGGVGNEAADTPLAGLANADPHLTFRYEEFVPCINNKKLGC